MRQLNQKNLINITSEVVKPLQRPTLNRICHIGVGNFHRSHQAIFTEDFMNFEKDWTWGITGIGIHPQETKLHSLLSKQDGLYTILTKSNANLEARIVGSITDFIHTATHQQKAIDTIANLNTEIVTLTITEGGYFFNQNTGEFDINHPSIQHDLKNPHQPTTVYGLLTLALLARKNTHNRPLTIMSCDNICENGTRFYNAFLEFLKNQNKLCIEWFKNSVAFPNSMVDRITPQSQDSDKEVVHKFGYNDACPVSAEPYTQWVIENNFKTSRPLWEKVGAQIVENVLPYEKVKLRLLNATHQALTYPGILLNYSYVHESIQNDLILSFVAKFMKEASTSLEDTPEINLLHYQHKVIERFRNKAIIDKLTRIASFSSDRIISFVLPILHDNLASNRSYKYTTFLLAMWFVYLQDSFEQDLPEDFVDNNTELLRTLCTKSTDSPKLFFQNEHLFSQLYRYNDFLNLFEKYVDEICEQGVVRVLKKIK